MKFSSKVLIFRKPLFVWMFRPNLAISDGGIWPKLSLGTSVQTSRSFIRAYNQVSMRFRWTVQARTSSYFEKPLFVWTFWPSSGNRIWLKLSKVTSSCQALPRLYDYPLQDTTWQKIDDGQTDGHPESIGPQPLGLEPNNWGIISSFYTTKNYLPRASVKHEHWL